MRVWKVFGVVLVFMLAWEAVLVADNSNKSMLDVLKDQDKIDKFKKYIIWEIKKTKSFKALDKDDKQWLLEYLEEEKILDNFNKNAFAELLDGDFSKEDKTALLNIFPDIYAWVPKITTEELENLATMKFRDVIDQYIKTWEIPKWFEVFKEDLEEIKAIIKDKEAIIKRWEEADRRWEKYRMEWEKYRMEWEKYHKLRKKIEQLIKKMKSLKQSSGKH